MGLTLKAVVQCNERCPACYEKAIPALWGDGPVSYEMAKIRAGITEWATDYKKRWPAEKPEITFHGGEPLLMKVGDMEDLFQLCKDLGVSISIQTNATMVTDRHILAFKTWDVGVGISLDGPWPLGRSRQLVQNPENDPNVMM